MAVLLTKESKIILNGYRRDNYQRESILNLLGNAEPNDQKIIDKRWNECQNCEHLIKATNTCKKCGCFMKIKIAFNRILIQ